MVVLHMKCALFNTLGLDAGRIYGCLKGLSCFFLGYFRRKTRVRIRFGYMTLFSCGIFRMMFRQHHYDVRCSNKSD